MPKLINHPDAFVAQAIEGILAAHPGWLRSITADNRALARADAPVPGQVGIVAGGGSGHLPAFLGYVGQGLATAVAIGNVFTAQSVDAALAATRAVDGGCGVLYLYGNFVGDRLNFGLASDLAAAHGIKVETVLVTDDLALAPIGRATERRGGAGMLFAYKTAGAAAERGGALEEVAAVARRTVAATRTLGVGLSAPVIPGEGHPTLALGTGEMEVGIGLRGEPGRRRVPLEPADAVADQLFEGTAAELLLRPGDRVAVLVNGMGATPLEELYVLYRRVTRLLGRIDVAVHRAYVGEYATSLDSSGASLSLLKLDDALVSLLDAPAASPLFRL